MSALSLNPSYYWEGNDGNWSTFSLRIGTPPQLVHVLPSTSGSSIWVVDPQGCEEAFTECPTLRGNLFNITNSSSFANKATSSSDPYFGLNFDPESSLGYNGTATVGLDIVALGNEGNVTGVLENQTVAVYADKFPWLGLFGLEVQNETVVNTNDQNESLLGRLNRTGTIPSAYWAYTAGASWLDVFASLTFGGYDYTRGDIGNALKVGLSSDSRNAKVSITGISITTRGSPVMAGGQLPIDAFIDSVVPEIWLPTIACQAFETAFNLTWNEELNLYLVSDDLHDMLVSGQHNVTFTLAANATDTNDTVEIVLPYPAFDLTAKYPLAGIRNATGAQRYFPLKRATSEDQYYLGRTFLQGAYLAVDYDRQEFAITQASYPDGSVRRIVTIDRPSTDNGSSNLSAGAVAGIVIGVVALLALVGGLIFFFLRRRKSQRNSKASTRRTSSIGGTTIEGWAEGITSQECIEPKGADGEIEDQFKPELDATATARPYYGFQQRHELSAGSVRRTSQQSGLSRASGVSPMVDHRASSQTGHRSISSFGPPTPGSPGDFAGPMSPRELSGVTSPIAGQSSPPLFELHADSRPQSRPLSVEPTDNADVIRPLLINKRDELFLPAGGVSPVREGSRMSRFEEQTDGLDMQHEDEIRSS